jgi:5'-methylthioadenosine phosphorylase
MAHVTDYDVWHLSEAPVTVEAVIAVLNQNTQFAQEAVRVLVRNLSGERTCDCPHALATARITAERRIPPETRQDLLLLVGKYYT